MALLTHHTLVFSHQRETGLGMVEACHLPTAFVVAVGAVGAQAGAVRIPVAIGTAGEGEFLPLLTGMTSGTLNLLVRALKRKGRTGMVEYDA
jgi:hypothetical protein